MSISFEGYNENVLTFEKDTGAIAVGDPVKISGSGKVSKCSTGDMFCGFAVSVRDSLIGVQMSGYREAKYADGTGEGVPAVALGYSTVTAEANGILTSAKTGNTILVVSKDANTMGFIF